MVYFQKKGSRKKGDGDEKEKNGTKVSLNAKAHLTTLECCGVLRKNKQSCLLEIFMTKQKKKIKENKRNMLIFEKKSSLFVFFFIKSHLATLLGFKKLF